MNRTFVLRTPPDMKLLGGFLQQNWIAMAQAGKPLAVTVSEHKAKRSGEQNRRYWKLLSHIAESAWKNGKQYTKEQWHGEFSVAFIGWDETPSGHVVPISTTTLDVAAFAEYMDRIEAHAATELQVEFSGVFA